MCRQNQAPIKQDKIKKRPLDTPKRMIERREKEREKGKRGDIEREGEIREREVGERDI